MRCPVCGDVANNGYCLGMTAGHEHEPCKVIMQKADIETRVAHYIDMVAETCGEHPVDVRRTNRGRTVEQMLDDIDHAPVVVYWGCIPQQVLDYVL